MKKITVLFAFLILHLSAAAETKAVMTFDEMFQELDINQSFVSYFSHRTESRFSLGFVEDQHDHLTFINHGLNIAWNNRYYEEYKDQRLSILLVKTTQDLVAGLYSLEWSQFDPECPKQIVIQVIDSNLFYYVDYQQRLKTPRSITEKCVRAYQASVNKKLHHRADGNNYNKNLDSYKSAL